MSKKFFRCIEKNPIIAAINDINKLDDAIKSDCEVIFLLTGNIFNLKELVSKIKENDMEVFIHLDLMEGFSRDSIALRYISENIKPDGILTTKSSLIRTAKELGLFVIQRLFILDSISVETGIRSIQSARPDAIEILPGTIHSTIEYICQKTGTAIITGGLIKTKDDVIKSLSAGAVAVSSSSKKIWNM